MIIRKELQVYEKYINFLINSPVIIREGKKKQDVYLIVTRKFSKNLKIFVIIQLKIP